jgi:plasmid stabilization system protein ParE
MSYPLIIAPEAERELERAVHWYNEQRPGLGRELLACVETAFDRIRRSPELHAVVYRGVRLTLVRRFPYVVCYLFNGETVTVVAVFHGHRDPKVWRERIRES